MSDVHIRAATPGDIAAIARIFADAVRYGTATFEVESPDEAEMARRMQALAASNYPYLVAERTGVIAGYAYAGPYHLRPAYRWTVEDSIYLDPPFHGLGIGRRLIRHLLSDVEARGFSANDCTNRRFDQQSFDRAARRGRFSTCRHAAIGRVQTWPLA
jgi:L-amino acid N-acyltransferase YncA